MSTATRSSSKSWDAPGAPRLHIAGCSAGNDDVGEQTADAIEAPVADEPPLCHPSSTPVHLSDCLELLAREAPVRRCNAGLIWSFPGHLSYLDAHDATLVGLGTHEGDRSFARLAKQGMPASLVAQGFVDIGELWAPWCIALHQGEVASIAFAAHLGPRAA